MIHWVLFPSGILLLPLKKNLWKAESWRGRANTLGSLQYSRKRASHFHMYMRKLFQSQRQCRETSNPILIVMVRRSVLRPVACLRSIFWLFQEKPTNLILCEIFQFFKYCPNFIKYCTESDTVYTMFKNKKTLNIVFE